jgi:hypothetical protein
MFFWVKKIADEYNVFVSKAQHQVYDEGRKKGV